MAPSDASSRAASAATSLPQSASDSARSCLGPRAPSTGFAGTTLSSTSRSNAACSCERSLRTVLRDRGPPSLAPSRSRRENSDENIHGRASDAPTPPMYGSTYRRRFER